MDTRFPVSISRPVAAAAQRRAFDDFQVPPIARLEQLQVGFIMTIKTIVVAMVPAVRHHNVIVLLRDHDISFRIQLQLRRFVFFVAGVAIQA
jgi:hypothetical protein